TIAPNALTRLGGADESAPEAETPVPGQIFLPSALVAPLAAYLAHEDLQETAQVYVAGGGRFGRFFVGANAGYVQLDPRPTIEDVAAHWREINDTAGYSVPASLQDWAGGYFAHQFAALQGGGPGAA
ncbi:MAG: hypothetical protein QM617_04195, partial [Comamonas sp.]